MIAEKIVEGPEADSRSNGAAAEKSRIGRKWTSLLERLAQEDYWGLDSILRPNLVVAMTVHALNRSAIDSHHGCLAAYLLDSRRISDTDNSPVEEALGPGAGRERRISPDSVDSLVLAMAHRRHFGDADRRYGQAQRLEPGTTRG